MAIEERKASILINKAGRGLRSGGKELSGGAALCVDEAAWDYSRGPGGAAAI